MPPPDPIQPAAGGHIATCPHPGCGWEAWQQSRDRLSTQYATHAKTHQKKKEEPR